MSGYEVEDYDAAFGRAAASGESALDAALGIGRASEDGVSQEAYDRVFGSRSEGSGASSGEDGELVQALVGAGLTEVAAARVVRRVSGGSSPANAALSETSIGSIGVQDQSVPVDMVRARVERVLKGREAATAQKGDPDVTLRGHLRAAMSGAQGRAVSEADAEAALDVIRQQAIRDGLSRPYFNGRVWKEIERLLEQAVARGRGRSTTGAHRPPATEGRQVRIIHEQPGGRK